MFYASKNRRRFHLLSCEYAGQSRVNQDFWASYDTHEEAIADGKLPCRYCNPCNVADVTSVFTEFSIPGMWTGDCGSINRPGCYAAFYTFTLSKATNVEICLRTLDGYYVDPYLYLMLGDSPDGQVLNDNGFLREDGESSIACNLQPGTYTVEATTSGEQEEGRFLLDVILG